MLETKYSEQWKALLAAVAPPEPEPTGEIELVGFKFIGRRLPLASYAQSGRLPQHFVQQLLELGAGTRDEVVMEELPPGEFAAVLDFQREAVMRGIVEPRIVDHGGPLAENEFRYRDLCEQRPDLINAVVNWVLGNCPGVPVKMEKGETSVAALNNFRPKQPEQLPVDAGDDRAEVRQTA